MSWRVAFASVTPGEHLEGTTTFRVEGISDGRQRVGCTIIVPDARLDVAYAFTLDRIVRKLDDEVGEGRR